MGSSPSVPTNMSTPYKFEYITFTTPTVNMEAELNARGQEGWDLVQVRWRGGEYHDYRIWMKRVIVNE